MAIPSESRALRRPTLWQLLRTQKRVIGALVLREVQMRYGREGLGAGWLVAEPLVFVFPVLVMWSYIRTRADHDVPVMELCWTGYLPLMLFRHVGGLIIRTMSANSALLYHRDVATLDVFLAKS